MLAIFCVLPLLPIVLGMVAIGALVELLPRSRRLRHER